MSEPTNCAACRDAFSAHFDGELASAELERFNSHLQSCKSCKTDYASLEKTAQSLDTWFSKTETLKMPEQETAAARAATSALHDPRGNTVWSMLLAAAVMLVITAGLFSMVGLSGSSPRTVAFHDAKPDLSPLPVPDTFATKPVEPNATDIKASKTSMQDELRALVAGLSSSDEKARQNAEAKLEAYLRTNGQAARDVLEQKIVPELLVNDADAEKRVTELLKRLSPPEAAKQ